MTYRACFQRDLAILRGPPGWRKTLLIFGMVLPIVGLCANVDMVTVDHATVAEIIWFDCGLLVIAATSANTARGWSWSGSTKSEPAIAPEEDAVEAERRKWSQKFTASA